VTGVDLITDLTTFFGLLGDMTKDFSARAAQVQELLHANTTGFLLVTSAQRERIDEAIWFRQTLEQSRLPFAGVLVNRVHHDLLGDAEPNGVETALASRLGPDLAAKVTANFLDYHLLARRDGANIERLEAELGDGPLLLVPHFDDDVHDIDGLLRIHRYLFASHAERARMIEKVVA
jgi:anion-transporting  ArsA/GET3 family ATPase